MASVRRTTVAAVLAVVPLALAGCGADEDPREPAADLTPDGIAAVVADHVAREPRHVGSWDVMTRELGVEAPGAVLVYRRGLSLSVAVAPTTDSPLVCGDESFFDECVDLDHDGHRLVLAWQELEPEEDPGIVYVIDRRDGEDVIADYSGVSIEGDPRDLDLGITLDEMAEIVTDQRLTLG
ncbi:hypothetical protein ASC64_12715 [Nocardioides sp. Root122]|uniref:hypothetical protein n=1 Tax=Nocardioides TaxID=1839 RepID=UPI000703A955|nr:MULTISPECIES: hypothetical protein [Nocardioides]KQV65765.1 hypothetical protein ASC64_12715 [Nocardioides sp. Root122]MCK9823325.1 hypothetical protein [Nocardioides cavernae]